MINITDRVVGNVNKVSVMNDKEVIKLDFKVKNQVTELLRLSDCDAIYINYQNGNTKDRYLVTDLFIEGDYATFSWTLGRNATRKDGKTFFVVCASVQNEGEIVQEWNTALSFFTVERGLETLTADVEPYSDIFAQLAEEIATKQDKLIAGDNITIDGNVISATGGTVDAYTKAETDALLDDKQDKGDYATETELTSGLATKQNTLTAGENITIENDVISASGGGTSDYSDLTNKPQINSVELNGNKSLADLGIQPSGSYATSSELSAEVSARQIADSGLQAQIDGKVNTSAIKQSEGQSTSDLMSQKAVTDALSGKLSNPMLFSSVSATFVTNTDSDYSAYAYEAVLSCQGVTASMLATVIFSDAQAKSGNYALTCVTGTDSVTIYSNDNTAITIPTVVAGNPIEVQNSIQSATVSAIWTGTEEEYEAITTKDADTLYFIVEV